MVHEQPATSDAVPQSSRPKKRWSDLTRGQQAAIVVGGIAELVMTATALRDLARRPAAQVRGPKALWVLSCFVQPIGPMSYFVLGRRHEGA
jgi:hypothetical protein